jgi:hypothetical protein
MSSIAHAQPAFKPAVPPLLEQLRRECFLPGPPTHLSQWSARIDAGICRRLVCPTCHVKGLDYHPFHRGPSYRVVAVCPRCGHGEER